MSTVVVVDYGMGNLRSVAKAIEHVAPEAEVRVSSADAAQIAAADRVVVPGQGAMPDCMRELAARGLREAVIEAAAEKPFLGICVGCKCSSARRRRRRDGPGNPSGPCAAFSRRGCGRLTVRASRCRTWAGTRCSRPSPPLWDGIEDGARFYFVHSYYVEPDRPGVIAGSTDYGIPFTSAVRALTSSPFSFTRKKAPRPGLRLLANFMRWKP
jgi:glutamine amidotransferase